MFFEDAKTAARELELTLTGKECGQPERAPMAGVPFHAAENYISRLIEKVNEAAEIVNACESNAFNCYTAATWSAFTTALSEAIRAAQEHGLQIPPCVSASPSRRGHLQSVLRDETLRHRLFRARQATRRDADGDRSDAFCGPPDRPLRLKASGTRARRTCGAVRRARGRSPWRLASEG